MPRPLVTNSGGIREITDSTPLTLPRGAAFPGSPAQGDVFVLTTDGLAYVYDGTAWVPSGVVSGPVGGFLSTDLANHYDLSSASACPGAANFIAVALVVPATRIDSLYYQPIIDKRNGSTGWRIAWEYGQLTGTCWGDGGSPVSAAIATTTWDSNRKLGTLHVVCMRVTSSGGDMQVNLWIGPAQQLATSASGIGEVPAPNTATVGQALNGTAGTADMFTAGAIFCGLGYYTGTVTDPQLRKMLGHAQATGQLPTDVITWDNLFHGSGVKTVPATWTAALGAASMTKVGSPTGEEAFFPPGGAANNVITAGGGGGGLSDYDVRARILALGT